MVLQMPALVLHQGDVRRLAPSLAVVAALLACAHEHVDVRVRRPLRSSLEIAGKEPSSATMKDFTWILVFKNGEVTQALNFQIKNRMAFCAPPVGRMRGATLS